MVNCHRDGPAAVTASNHLQREFDVVKPNRLWVTDVTYIRTYEGWLLLAVVIALFSRQVIGWSMGPSMSRRGNCHDNAVAERFFQLLRGERIRRKIYLTRNLAKQDVFDYIEMGYNPKRRHSVCRDVTGGI